MKNQKRPTKRQKIAIAAANANPDDWYVIKNPPGRLYIVHKLSGRQEIITV